ncbi:MAG: carboxypeptidase regulatory-like domain-containing protein [Pyrinomonadaceae bacterium]|nr:carboxypeptidase regulatory-like domain-containing protein [Blastocatellia bacterium]MCW5955562.1 carboxypeptidase regulatory-like domain-containing protein [Pyrinomonadaceae bacterium]
MRFSDLKALVHKTTAIMFVLGALVVAGFAQAGTSGVSGTVRDKNGAAVPGASVKLSNSATGFERTTTTNAEGGFSFLAVPPATYQVEITASGFKKLVNSSLQLPTDTTVRFDGSLEAGDVSAVVNVTSGGIESIVNTQDASIGNTIGTEQIIQLPTDLRRVNDLLALQPGVTRDGYVAGGRSDQANITLDGVDINDQQTGGRSFTGDVSQESALRATTESVEEFRITTLGANANQGRSSGAQVSLVTKSGTNNLRGAVFYFKRPTMGSANNFFNNLAGVARPSIARDVYGGAIGGPIKKDRLFFFYSYEGQYQKLDASVNRVVPLAHLGQGSIKFRGTGPSCVAGVCTVGQAELNNTIYSAVGINQLAVNALRAAATSYASNNTTVGDGLNTGGFLFNSPSTDKENTHIVRLDWNPAGNQQIFFRGNYQWDNASGTSAFPDTPTTSLWSHPYGFVVGHNWTISNNKINNFRYGLTRQAFSSQGDSAANSISFRFVFSPLLFSRTLNRVTPVQNITDDFTWIKGNHTFQFGGNVRIIRNERQSFGNAYDSAITNPSFYASSGAVLQQRFTANGYTINGGDISSVQAAAAALIGRYSQYSGNFTFDIDGSVLPAGTAASRTFATEEYDSYIQDVWKFNSQLTLTMGLRYAVSRPVYEKNGFQVIPTERLGDYFERRVASSNGGRPLNDLIQFQLGGPKNNAPGFYSMDWNNFQPRIAAAWSPDFKNKFLQKLIGKSGEAVFRGGFGISNDYFGGQLAVSFDGLSTIGFTSAATIAANTYNVTTNPAPLFTGYGQNIRALPGIPAPQQRFITPADEAQRIETSLDATITSPTHYTWNFSYGRDLPKGMYFEASYIGRAARNLFGTRDVMALNNLRDPISGMDWYTAAGILHDRRAANTPYQNVTPIAYFENLFPGLGANFWGDPSLSATQSVFLLVARDQYDILDWTYVQALIDDYGLYPNMFFHPQYAAFSAYGTFAKSDYHGATFTLRQRLGQILRYDINYTFSKSTDDVSGLQTDGSYGGQFLLNPLRQQDNHALSDFDATHVVNANFLFDLPVGRGRKWFSDMNKWADAFVGGWSLNGIYRWNTGQPISPPFDQAQWATNWNVQSNGFRIRPLSSGVFRDTRNFFADRQAAFNSFRNARPGETGERNTFRAPGYQTLDLGLSKSVTMPWNENHKFQFRWEVFNVTNVQYFAVTNQTRTTWGLPQDPETGTAASSFGQIFTDIQGTPRRMQFGLRYSF